MFEADLKGADIQTEVKELPSECSVVDVLCDPSRLLQIIINLITNAVKFTRNSDTRHLTLAYAPFSAPPSAQDCGVQFIKPRKKDHDETETISAMLAAEDSDDSADDIYLMFSVTDTGCGLSPEESQLLFQRFAQGKPHAVTFKAMANKRQSTQNIQAIWRFGQKSSIEIKHRPRLMIRQVPGWDYL